MKNLHAFGRPDRRGAALMIALCAVAVVAALAMGFLLMLGTINRSHGSSLDRSESFYLAEAGLSEAYAGLVIGKTGNVGTKEAPARFGNGLFWTEAEEVADERVQITSTGMAGTQRVVLSLVAQKTAIGAAALGVFASGDLRLPAGSLVDGYDSRLGSYAEQAAKGLEATQAGRLAANGSIKLQGSMAKPTLVNGDAAPGPHGTLTSGEHARVTGKVAAAVASIEPPPAVAPSIPLLPPLAVAAQSPPVVLAPGDYGFTSLSLAEGTRVELAGPVRFVVGNAELASGASLAFDTTLGRVDVYVTGALAVGAGATVGAGNDDPTRASVQIVGGGDVSWNGTSPFYGVLYAPESEVNACEGFEAYGAVIANELVLQPGAKLHFDRALLSEAACEDALPELLAWRIVDLGPERGGAGPSPFATLGVDKDDLVGPSAAHADQELKISYVDHSGAVQTYSGLESGFDWSQVAAVLSIVRDGTLVTLVEEAAPAAAAAGPYSPADQALIDLLSQGLDTGDIKDALLAASPLSGDVLAHLLSLPTAGHPMSPSDVDAVINDNLPFALADLLQILTALLENPDPPLDGSDFKNVLEQSSPLPAGIADAVLDSMLASAGNPMSSGEMTDILIANSPLSGGILSIITGGLTTLSLLDILDILAAQ